MDEKKLTDEELKSFKIAPLLCKIIPETMYCVESLRVKMPKSSQYVGYATTIYAFVKKGFFYEVLCPRKKDYVFELVKIRKKGDKGRYKRYRLSWQELTAEFQEHQKQFDISNLPKALVYAYDYDYRGCVELSRRGCFLIGAVSGKWFWTNDYKRYLISAKNFRLITMLEEEEIESVEKLIATLERTNYELFTLTEFNGVRDKVKGLPIIKEIQSLALKKQEMLDFVEGLIEERKANIEQLNKDLETLSWRAKEVYRQV